MIFLNFLYWYFVNVTEIFLKLLPTFFTVDSDYPNKIRTIRTTKVIQKFWSSFLFKLAKHFHKIYLTCHILQIVKRVILKKSPKSFYWCGESHILHIVVVTKKPLMCRIMRFSLYCMNRSIEGRHIDEKNSYVRNSRFYHSECFYLNLCADQPQKPPIDGLLRKLRNSKFGQGWGFWFVGGNSDSPSSSLDLRGLKKIVFSFLIKIITDLGLFRWWRITGVTYTPGISILTEFGVTEFSH